MNQQPRLTDNGLLECPAGYGYWSLTSYPWGGAFRRFRADCVATDAEVMETYRDGSPRKVVAMVGGEKIGVQL